MSIGAFYRSRHGQKALDSDKDGKKCENNCEPSYLLLTINMAWYLRLSVFCYLIAVGCNVSKAPHAADLKSSFSTKTAIRHDLTVDEVLNWRASHGGDLLGKDKDAVTSRYGVPDPTSTGTRMEYTAEVKALDRATWFLINGAKVAAIKVHRKEGDFLNVEEVIKKATLFTFDTGTFHDTTSNYFTATTKDGRNIIQFVVSDSGVSLAAVMYVEKP
jgi:hypothetical protein